MNQDVGRPASEWLSALSVAELSYVIDACGHSLEPILCERIAEAIIQRQRQLGPYQTTQDLVQVLEEWRQEFADEHPTLCLPQIVFTAIRVFMNREMEQFNRVLHGALCRLRLWGRLVVITFNKWEVVALRRFLRDHEEPSSASAAALSKLSSK